MGHPQKKSSEELSTCSNVEECSAIESQLKSIDWDLLINHMDDVVSDGADHFVINYLEKMIRLPLHILIEDRCAEGQFLVEC